MKKYCVAISLVFILMIVVILAKLNSKDEELVNPNETFKITASDMPKIVKRAKSGETAAMKKLALHYGMYDENYDKQNYWLFQAAEAGDVDTQRFLIGFFESSNILSDRNKAKQLRKKWGIED